MVTYLIMNYKFNLAISESLYIFSTRVYFAYSILYKIQYNILYTYI